MPDADPALRKALLDFSYSTGIVHQLLHFCCLLPTQGFAGLPDADPALRKALLDFSYFTAIGNMEEAFKAVQAVHSPGLWESLAKLAIRSKRLDVAEHCMGYMENARGARAVRQCRDIAEVGGGRMCRKQDRTYVL